MKRTIFLCLLIFFAAAGYAASYPSYEEIIRHFYNNYSKRELGPAEILQFQKRTDGWHVAIRDYSSDITITKRQELLWSRLTLQYQKLSFPEKDATDQSEELIEETLRSYEKNFYAIYPYYGYPGWSADVIKELEGKENLSDTLLYALARAYSDHAGSLLHDYQNMGDPKTAFNLPDGPNSMTASQLEAYRKYAHLAIRSFEKLSRQNPLFETIVGRIGVKYWNEYLTAFLDIWMYQNYEEALKELPDGLYNEFYRGMAKNYLESCAPNAILFTNGDNDTYPLLYVQAKLGIRRDVIVANLSLLQTSRYIEHLRRRIFDAPPLDMSLKPEVYKDRQRDVIYLGTENATPIDLEKVIQYIADDNNKTNDLGPQNIIYLPQNKFRLETAGGTLTWTCNKSYILKNKLAIIDILSTSKLQRPIYYAVTTEFDEFMGLEQHLWLEGLTYRLKTEKVKSEGQADTEVMLDNMMNKFDWNLGGKLLVSNEKQMGTNYRIQFINLADALLKEGKKKEAMEVLKKHNAVLPGSILPHDYTSVNLVRAWYEAGNISAANSIALKIIEHHAPQGKLEPYQIDEDLYFRIDHSFKVIKALAEKYKQKEIENAAEKAWPSGRYDN